MLLAYPLEITDEIADSSAMMTAMMGNVQPNENKHDIWHQ